MHDLNATLAIKGGGLISSSALMSNMIIFTDPAYILLAVIGATLSLFGMAHEMLKAVNKGNGKRFSYIIMDLIKALALGGILTPMYFMMYMHTGETIISLFVGLNGFDGIFNSFWWLLSLLTAWYSPLIWEGLLTLIKSRCRRKLDE
jgi:hypothetical protein